MVQSTLSLCHCLVSNISVVESLWEVLLEQTICVFIGSALTAVVRVSELDLHR